MLLEYEEMSIAIKASIENIAEKIFYFLLGYIQFLNAIALYKKIIIDEEFPLFVFYLSLHRPYVIEHYSYGEIFNLKSN